MIPRQTFKPRACGRYAAAFCLAALLGSLGWVRLLAVLVIATADGSHWVSLSAQSPGFSVILHHRHGTGSAAPVNRLQLAAHRHGVAAKVLMVLADDASSQADHVLRVDSGSVRFVSTPALSSAPPNVAILPTVVPAGWIPSPWDGVVSARRPRPPPLPSAMLAQLRATVLLI